jgi:hypothetical protein
MVLNIAHAFFGDAEQCLGPFVGNCTGGRIARVIDWNTGALDKTFNKIAQRRGKPRIAYRIETHLGNRDASFLQSLMGRFLGAHSSKYPQNPTACAHCIRFAHPAARRAAAKSSVAAGARARPRTVALPGAAAVFPLANGQQM